MTKASKCYIDGDVLKYMMGFAVQKTIWTHLPTGEFFEGKQEANDWMKSRGENPRTDWAEDDWESELQVEPFSHCTFLLDGKISECIANTKTEGAVVCLTPSETFRHRVAFTKPYKGHRTSPKPFYNDQIIEYLESAYGAVVPEDLEADDVMGMSGCPICTNDKDLDMIVGMKYNFSTGETHWTSPDDADAWFYTQLIAGDPTDNIPGIPKMGIKKAMDVVEMYRDDFGAIEVGPLLKHIEDLYVGAYSSNYQDVMEEHAELVYILRPGDTVKDQAWRKLLDEPETS